MFVSGRCYRSSAPIGRPRRVHHVSISCLISLAPNDPGEDNGPSAVLLTWFSCMSGRCLRSSAPIGRLRRVHHVSSLLPAVFLLLPANSPRNSVHRDHRPARQRHLPRQTVERCVACDAKPHAGLIHPLQPTAPPFEASTVPRDQARAHSGSAFALSRPSALEGDPSGARSNVLSPGGSQKDAQPFFAAWLADASA